MKAKRSLSNSFDHLLKRKASKDDFNPILKDLTLPIVPINRESSPISPHSSNQDISEREPEEARSRSSTFGSQNDLKERLAVKEHQNKSSLSPERSLNEKGPKSPMMDMYVPEIDSAVSNSPYLIHDNISDFSKSAAVPNRIRTKKGLPRSPIWVPGGRPFSNGW